MYKSINYFNDMKFEGVRYDDITFCMNIKLIQNIFFLLYDVILIFMMIYCDGYDRYVL